MCCIMVNFGFEVLVELCKTLELLLELFKKILKKLEHGEPASSKIAFAC